MSLKEEVLEHFRAYDGDGSGFISREKLTSVLVALRMSAPSVAKLIQLVEDSEDPSTPVRYEKFINSLYRDSSTDSSRNSLPAKKSIIIIGPVGCGRSTQAKLVAERYNVVEIAVGAMLWGHVEKGDDLGLQAKAYMERSELVPDEIVQQVLERRLVELASQNQGFVMIGYPRTPEQAKHLLTLNIRVDALIHLDFSQGSSSQHLVRNFFFRRIDPLTTKVYDIERDWEHISPDVRARLIRGRGQQDDMDLEKNIARSKENCLAIARNYPAEVVCRVDGDRHKLSVFEDIQVFLDGHAKSHSVVHRQQTATQVVQRMAWSLRSVLLGDSSIAENGSFKTLGGKVQSSEKRLPLVILHFNDVYELKEARQEPVGGPARIAGKMQEFDAEQPLVLFSGDALNPSLLSQSTKGSHMIEVLNGLGVAASVIGNHDLDFGADNLTKQIAASNFPWLCSNCWHKDTLEPLAGSIEACVIQHQGYKIGVMGLVEEEWLYCCANINPSSLDYVDFVLAGRAFARKLRSEECVDFVVALTHFREPGDERLAMEAPEIDLILGGHDHHYSAKKCDPHGTWYVKSGTDFRYLSKVTMEIDKKGRAIVGVEKHDITRGVPEEGKVKSICTKYLKELEATLALTIGHIKREMDARFEAVRTRETNVGNWCADVLRDGCQCDIALLNSGALRADCVYPAGKFTLEDLMRLLPFTNELMVVELNGALLLSCLENAVSTLPKRDGNFVQVSGIKFKFDSSKDAGERVLKESVMVGDGFNGFEPLDAAKVYSVGSLAFMAKGNQGFTAFLEGTVVWDEEVCTPLGTLVRNNLSAIKVLNQIAFHHEQKTHQTVVRASACFKARDAFKQVSDGYSPTMESLDEVAQLEDTEIVEFGVDAQLEGRIINVA